MTLFFVGVVEMIIAAYWTRSVAKANALMTGLVTMMNIFIWYYVIQTVIENLGDWTTIIPYAFGCTAGAMLGAVIDGKKIRRALQRRVRRLAKERANARLGTEAPMPNTTYDPL